MSLLLGLLAIMGAAGALLWRMSNTADAARQVVDTADDAQGLLRRWLWRRKTRVDLLGEIQDPREAAACMMVAVAQTDGALSDREHTAIIEAMVQNFQSTTEDADAMFARARWLVRDAADAASCFTRLQSVIMKSLAEQERRDLITMLTTVATADGEIRQAERDAIARLREHLLPG
jgi:uncharacterized tellurite resistance protein B-like protein